MRVRGLITVLIPVAALSQSAPRNLVFDEGDIGKPPPHWTIASGAESRGYSALTTDKGCKSGRCLVLAASRDDTHPGTLTQRFQADTMRQRNFRLEAVMRVDPDSPVKRIWLSVEMVDAGGTRLSLDTMVDQPVTSTAWRDVEIAGYVPSNAQVDRARHFLDRQGTRAG